MNTGIFSYGRQIIVCIGEEEVQPYLRMEFLKSIPTITTAWYFPSQVGISTPEAKCNTLWHPYET